MKLSKSSVYRRYLKYYSLMLILPAAALCLVIGLLVNQLYVRTIFDNHQATITRIGRTLDNGLGSIEVLGARLNSATWLRPETLHRSPINVMKAIENLKEAQASNPFLSDIVYRLLDGGLVISSTSGANEKWSGQLLKSARDFSITYKVPLRAKTHYGEISFVLNKWYLSEYIATEIALCDEALEIWNGDTILYATGIASGDYYAITYDSRVFEWQFRFLTPKAPVEAGQRKVYLYLAGGVFMLFGLGFLLIVRLARLTYSPVGKIDSFVRTLIPPDSKAGNDEFDWMYQALSKLHENDSVLRARASLMEDAYRAIRLMSLIKGELRGEAELKRLEEELRSAENTRRLVALIRQQEGDEQVRGLPESLTKGGVDVHIIPLPEPGMTALFIEEREEGQTQRLLASAGETFRLRVGIGNAYGPLLDASKSYIEAEAALYYATDTRPIVPYRELEKRRTAYRYPRKEIQRVTAALMQRSEKEIGDAVGALVKSLRQEIFPVSIVRCICYDVIATVIKLSIDLTNQHSFPTAAEVHGIQSIEELMELMNRCVDGYVETLARDKRKNDYIFAQIMEYVDAHVFSADFSIGGMASALGFSQSYLSHLYKAKVGGNLIQLVSERRINRAKTLLRDTEMPLKDIIEQIGYTDPSNFIRKFKQETGLTPGEYKAKEGKYEEA